MSAGEPTARASGEQPGPKSRLETDGELLAEAERQMPFLALENRLLRNLVRGVPLAETLVALCSLIESRTGGAACELLTFDRARGGMERVASSRLPPEYTAAMPVLVATSEASPLGVAAGQQEPVLVADFVSDPRWRGSEWSTLTSAQGLCSCWCAPISSPDSGALGICAIYWSEPQTPSGLHWESAARLLEIAGLAIAQDRRIGALRESEERFRRIFDGVPGMVCTLSASGQVEHLSRPILEYFGKTLEELKQWATCDAVHPEDLPRAITQLTHSVATGRPYDSEERHRRHDGVYRWHQVRALPYRDDAGTILGWYLLITDIDERVKAAEALRRSEVYLNEAQRLSHTGSFSWRVETGELSWSAETYRIMGCDPAERPSLETVLARNHPDDRQLVHETMERVSRTREDIDFKQRLLLPDGTVKHVHVVARASPQSAEGIEFVGALMDITEQERTKDYLERALEDRRASETHFRAILNAMPTHVWSTRSDGSAEFLNQQWLDFTGFTSEKAEDWGWSEAVHPADVEGLIQHWTRIMASGEAGEAEARLRRHDGIYRWFLMRVVPIKNEQGATVRWYGTNTDIEDLKRTSEALRSSEQFSRGQTQALSHIVNALASESSQDRVIEHVLSTITTQLDAHSCSVWTTEPRSGSLDFEFSLVLGEFRTKAEVKFPTSFKFDRTKAIWPGTDFSPPGKPHLMEDIREGPDFPWRAHLLSQGVISILIVPMMVAGEVSGLVGIQFTRTRVFRPEEVQLAQTLANQAMLAMQLSRISAQSRETAVLAERNRLARDIHDTLAQGFTGVIVQLEAAADASSRGLPTAAADHLRRARERASESLMDARRSVQALRPQALERGDLCGALAEMSRKMTARTTLRTKLNVTGEPRVLPEEWEDNLLRIVQECITNALRYADAEEIALEVAFAADELRVEVSDNGCGFDVSARSDGFGLIGMRERVEQMGGALTITSAPGRGTTTLIVLKCPNLPGVPPV